MKLSILVPVYNEEKTIESIVERLHTLSLKNITKELIIINDGSTDKTAKVLKDILKDKKNIIHIFHQNNKGKGQAIRSGIEKATGEYILIQDADLEYDPSYIPELIKPLVQNKSQVVYGTRLKRLPNIFQEEKTPRFLLHYLGNRFLSALVSVLYSTWLTDIETGYKLIPRKFFKDIKINSTGFEIEAEITVQLLKRGYHIFEVPIKTKPRGYQQGKKLQTIPDGIKAVKMILKHRFI